MKNRLKLSSIIFIIAFFSALFFTYGFHFFWEDFDLYRLDKEKYPIETNNESKILSAIKISSGFVKQFFQPRRLFQIGYGAGELHRPYGFITRDLLRTFFNDNIVFYRVFKALVFAFVATLVFYIISYTSIVLAFLGAFLYITSSEMWLTTVYSCDTGLYIQCGILLSILIFLRLLKQDPLDKKRMWGYYFLLLMTSNYAVLSRGVGRDLAIIFFLTVLFFRRTELKYHLPMLTILLFMEIPVLGFLKKVFVDSEFIPIDIKSHNPLPLFDSAKLAVKNYIYPVNALGAFMLVILIGCILIQLFIMIFKIKIKYTTEEEDRKTFISERLFLFMLLFVSSVVMMALARSFNYEGHTDWQVVDCSFFIAPFLIFICYYITLLSNSLKEPYSRLFIGVCVALMVMQLVVINPPRLNRFRGGWGNYFPAWRNAEKYINKTADNALALSINRMHYKPFVFRESNNKIINTLPPCEKSPFCDLNFIETEFHENRYKDIFVVGWGGWGPLNFRGESGKIILKEVRSFSGDTGDLYDIFKNFIGHGSVPMVYVYHFILKT